MTTITKSRPTVEQLIAEGRLYMSPPEEAARAYVYLKRRPSDEGGECIGTIWASLNDDMERGFFGTCFDSHYKQPEDIPQKKFGVGHLQDTEDGLASDWYA
jgi:hypothetical protein